MPEVPRVQGPGGPLEPGGKGKVPTDADKFKEMMKVEKVHEVDPEEKKKRKRREEQEDEGEELAQPPTAKPFVTDTILTPQDKEMKLGTARAEGPSRPSAPAPSEEPPPASQAASPQAGAPAESSPEEQESSTGQIESRSGAPITPQSPGRKTAQGTQKAEESAEGFLAARAKEKKEELEAAESEKISSMPAASEGPHAERKKREDEQSMQPISGEAPIAAPFAEGQAFPMASVSGLPSYISPQVYALFEKMVGVITVMVESDVKETSITLNSPEFASSVFFGSQIIIQEYATAPNQFNIQIIGNADAVKIFEGNAQDLLASLNSGKYNFRINRLDVGERPLVRRKEKLSDEKRDNLG